MIEPAFLVGASGLFVLSFLFGYLVPEFEARRKTVRRNEAR
jgi:hypothetical protein